MVARLLGMVVSWQGMVRQCGGRVETTCWLGSLVLPVKMDVAADTTSLKTGQCCPPRQNLGIRFARAAKPLISLGGSSWPT